MYSNGPEQNYQGGRGSIKGTLSQQTFSYMWTRDGSDKRRAIAECESLERQIQAANEQRAGRAMSMREHLAGRADTPDTRPIGQQVREDATVTSQPKPDPDRNPYTLWRQQLEGQPTYNSDLKAQVKRRLKIAKEKEEEWEAKRQAAKEQEARKAAAENDIVDAKAAVVLIRTNPEFAQDDVDRAVQRQTNLETTLDTAAYRRDRDTWEGEVKERRNAKAQALLAEAAKLRQEGKQAKESSARIDLVAEGEQLGIDTSALFPRSAEPTDTTPQ